MKSCEVLVCAATALLPAESRRYGCNLMPGM